MFLTHVDDIVAVGERDEIDRVAALLSDQVRQRDVGVLLGPGDSVITLARKIV